MLQDYRQRLLSTCGCPELADLPSKFVKENRLTKTENGDSCWKLRARCGQAADPMTKCSALEHLERRSKAWGLSSMEELASLER
mmetsp:Transcript_16124/g.61503  ORF Transcript_16124/g.61503 Transcript_16124/m.61503 type:complete len:84 (-) Transcript_16124:140-391(-)